MPDVVARRRPWPPVATARGNTMAGSSTVVGLNGFRAVVRPGTFTAHVRALPDPGDLEQLRAAAGKGWALWWQDGTLLGLPNGAVNGLEGATETTLDVREHLGFVAYLINNALPSAIPHYSAFRQRPFTFLGQRREFVREIRRQMPGAPRILDGFAIRPRYSLEARVIEPVDEAFVGLFVTLSTRCDITADLAGLAAAGVDLAGLDVVRRKPEPGQRRLVGRIDRLAADEVVLSESLDGLSRVPASELAVEGSREALATCLRATLGSRYEIFEKERQRLEGELLGGPGIDAMLTEMGRFLASVSPIVLGDGLECTIDERLTIGNTDQYRSVHRADPVTYCYDPARTKQDRYAWRGLATYGPFSRDTFATKSPQILVVVPETVQGTAETFVRAFRDGVSGRAYPSGFAATFRLANPSFVLQRVDAGVARPHEAYRRAIETALGGEQRYDVAIVVIQDEHADLPAAVKSTSTCPSPTRSSWGWAWPSWHRVATTTGSATWGSPRSSAATATTCWATSPASARSRSTHRFCANLSGMSYRRSNSATGGNPATPSGSSATPPTRCAPARSTAWSPNASRRSAQTRTSSSPSSPSATSIRSPRWTPARAASTSAASARARSRPNGARSSKSAGTSGCWPSPDQV